MTDTNTLPLGTSEETWKALFDEPVIPEELQAFATWNPFAWITTWRRQYLLRRRIAEQEFAKAQNPERGLPVASSKAVVAFLKTLLAKRHKSIFLLILLNTLAALSGLIVPKLLGNLVDIAHVDLAQLSGQLNSVALICVGVVLLQGLLSYAGRAISTVFGQSVLAEAREEIVRKVLRLPLSRVENASTGDLVTRVTRDVSNMSVAVRWALPHFVVAFSTIVLTFFGMLANSWLLTIPVLICLVVLLLAIKRYLHHAIAGYIAEGARYSQINSTLTESVEGARTVEALSLSRQRVELSDDDVAVCAQNDRYTGALRREVFAVMDVTLNIPTMLIVLVGLWAYPQGLVSLGEITTAAVYSQMLIGPLDLLTFALDYLQIGMASTTRLLGVAEVPADREPKKVSPRGSHLVAKDLRFAYDEGRDVLHGIDLDLKPGERLAIVGPSGSGKSTLGRLLAGINRPRTGQVTVGGVDVMDLPLESLRSQVALVTQEHHVFVGTIRDNIVLAREGDSDDEAVWQALEAVEAADWVRHLQDGLDTLVGSGNMELTPGQAQQIALARLVLADPHTLVLDEATSLIDPKTARELEGSMVSLLEGRTVVAIAHRLHTAHDADRIAVVIDGRIEELGSHDELLALDGEYASLWRAWTS